MAYSIAARCYVVKRAKARDSAARSGTAARTRREGNRAVLGGTAIASIKVERGARRPEEPNDES